MYKVINMICTIVFRYCIIIFYSVGPVTDFDQVILLIHIWFPARFMLSKLWSLIYCWMQNFENFIAVKFYSQISNLALKAEICWSRENVSNSDKASLNVSVGDLGFCWFDSINARNLFLNLIKLQLRLCEKCYIPLYFIVFISYQSVCLSSSLCPSKNMFSI